MHSCTFIFSKIIMRCILMAPHLTCSPAVPVLLKHPYTHAHTHNFIFYKNLIISFTKLCLKSCVVVVLHQDATVWFTVSDAGGWKCISAALYYSELAYVLHVEDYSEYVATGRAVREIFVMCQCYSLLLAAISLPQKGSAERVILFCVLIGLLSRKKTISGISV